MNIFQQAFDAFVEVKIVVYTETHTFIFKAWRKQLGYGCSSGHCRCAEGLREYHSTWVRYLESLDMPPIRLSRFFKK